MRADTLEVPVDLKFNPSIHELIGLLKEIRNYTMVRQALTELFVATAPGYVPKGTALTLEQAREFARMAISKS